MLRLMKKKSKQKGPINGFNFINFLSGNAFVTSCLHHRKSHRQQTTEQHKKTEMTSLSDETL